MPIRAYGSDRFRMSGGKIILHSRFSKGWVPRTPKTLTSAEFPGTAVYWDEQYYEVLSADLLPAGGIRYVLAEWPDAHAFRVFEAYNEESEARVAKDYAVAKRQRRNSLTARILAMFVGHAPTHVQMHLANELGLFPHRLTLWSIVPVLVLAGTLVYVGVGTFMDSKPQPFPDWLIVLTAFMLSESVFRFFVAMTQWRAMGSLLGTFVYLFIWLLHPHRERLASPFASAKGEGVGSLPPPSVAVEIQDVITMRGPLLTLLTPAEQAVLAERYGFDYRKHAYGITWALLICAALGVASMVPKATQSFSALVSLVCAGLVVLEQVMRLFALRRGPVGSVFGVMVRPFARDLLRRK